MTTQAAKTLLAEQIVAQVEHDGIPLSETERKMLYFSETSWTLPDMAEISEEFDSNYDQAEYEKKIGGVVRSFLLATTAERRKEIGWDNAGEVMFFA